MSIEGKAIIRFSKFSGAILLPLSAPSAKRSVALEGIPDFQEFVYIPTNSTFSFELAHILCSF